jgi:glycosyltransferase involved in cell wall biosynthesis
VKVAALIPAYRASAHLGGVLSRLRTLEPAPHVLVVDDGSRDTTAEVARAGGADVVSFPENRGKGHALIAGFRVLRDFDAVVTLDADGQHPPECLPRFVGAAESGADLVLGCRARSANMPFSRRFANAFSSGWTSWLAGRPVSDSQSGFRLHRRELLLRTPMTAGRYELETEMIVRAARLGFRLAEIEIPTVYGEEESQFRPARDVPRIVGTLTRLTLEGILPPPAMRAARASIGTPDARAEPRP